METKRKAWNQGQQLLRRSLIHPDQSRRWLELFLDQHGMVHASTVAQKPGLWSFEDELLEGLQPAQMRMLPAGGEHTLAWVFWHLTRIEDVTMNVLVSGEDQLLLDEEWLNRLKVQDPSTANATDVPAVETLSREIDLDALSAYRLAVGLRTRRIVAGLSTDDLKRKTPPDRIQRLAAEGAVVEAAGEILDYWSGLTVAGLLLMPPTRHTFLHLNEASRIKDRLRRQKNRSTR
jgi:hypothetical protein